jgi:hypothetical protein
MSIELRCSADNLFLALSGGRFEKVCSVSTGGMFCRVISMPDVITLGTVFMIANEDGDVGGGWSVVGESDFFSIVTGSVELEGELAGVLITAT